MSNSKQQLREMKFDPAFSDGAHNAVTHCLRIQPQEKVTLITDRACCEIAASLAAELDNQKLVYEAFILEDLAPRPLMDMPAEVLADMETSDVSIFAVKAQQNELRTRMQMTDVVNRRKMRHAHMVNIDRRLRRGRSHQHAGMADGQRGARNPRYQPGGHLDRGQLFAAVEMAQDERHHQPA
jgi:hypothetical protein